MDNNFQTWMDRPLTGSPQAEIFQELVLECQSFLGLEFLAYVIGRYMARAKGRQFAQEGWPHVLWAIRVKSMELGPVELPSRENDDEWG